MSGNGTQDKSRLAADTTKRFGKEIRNAQRARKPVTGLLALRWMVGCGEVFTVPDLDTPDGRVLRSIVEVATTRPIYLESSHEVPDPRSRTMAE